MIDENNSQTHYLFISEQMVVKLIKPKIPITLFIPTDFTVKP